jgi:small conductance mechanosensitive channel
MPSLILAAKGFPHDYGNEIRAVITLLLAIGLAVAVNRALSSRGRRLAAALGGGGLSPVVDTRLRFLRRVIDAVIILIGAALALAQFAQLDRIASTVLASSAIAAAVIGFAARQVLANAMAGMVLAVTQPLRIGDLVTFEGETGTVEDISLISTWLRTGSDARLIVPNERLAAGILRNDSIRSPTVALEVSLWLAPDADETSALEALDDLEDVTGARIAEITEAGIRVLVSGPAVIPAERLRREGELRAHALRAVREAGVPRAGAGA